MIAASLIATISIEARSSGSEAESDEEEDADLEQGVAGEAAQYLNGANPRQSPFFLLALVSGHDQR